MRIFQYAIFSITIHFVSLYQMLANFTLYFCILRMPQKRIGISAFGKNSGEIGHSLKERDML
ncbi:hypothetical protein A7K69_07800 [Parageobacillus thermoglucosidasius]|uniref:Uncharacterized protein n=1 Tax=Parageobacillus thermoglucosidasius TaxID=1426 RepID=A0A1B7KRW4_PARTM|nr:hypothetical protein A7K69_07800 [Parageobacillus thermoglucosidasius]